MRPMLDVSSTFLSDREIFTFQAVDSKRRVYVKIHVSIRGVLNLNAETSAVCRKSIN